MSKNVVFDFDGVIHSYKSGWQGPDVISDPPVEGIKEAICAIRDAGYRVYVLSARCSTPEGVAAVQGWLKTYDIYVDGVVDKKPPAVAYIDDRAICFDGDSQSLLEKIENFKPWYNKKNQEKLEYVGGSKLSEIIESLKNTKPQEIPEIHRATKQFIISAPIEESIQDTAKLIDGLTKQINARMSIRRKEKYIELIRKSKDTLEDLIETQKSYIRIHGGDIK